MSRFRVTTAGESHGPAEICIVEGIPSGLRLVAADIDVELARRQEGYGRGGRMRIETDRCRLLAGVRLGATLGTPICIMVENVDHANWSGIMSVEPSDGEVVDEPSVVSVPRPGHADLAGVSKHGFADIRSVLERASARETVGRVAGGAVCKRVLRELGVTVRARVTAIGEARVSPPPDYARPGDVDWQAVDSSPVGCDDPRAGAEMCEAIDRARTLGESLGGVFEVWCWGVCPGLGGYATAQDRLDGRLLGALGSIPAIKGVEVGQAFSDTTRMGSEIHDPLLLRTSGSRAWIDRSSNRAGGLEGGMSNGMPIILRAAMKPIPTLTTPLPSVDIATLEVTEAHVERSDITAVPAARVVAEAMVAQVIADAYLDKFGGDSMGQLLEAVAGYRQGLRDRGLWDGS